MIPSGPGVGLIKDRRNQVFRSSLVPRKRVEMVKHGRNISMLRRPFLGDNKEVKWHHHSGRSIVRD